MVWLFKLHVDFARLIDNPTVLPYLEAWVDSKVRIDHAYGLVHLPGEGAELHGGPDAAGVAWYQVHGGAISCGLTVVSYALTDGSISSGGFRCVPGSHKGTFVVDEAGADEQAHLTDRQRRMVLPPFEFDVTTLGFRPPVTSTAQDALG